MTQCGTSRYQLFLFLSFLKNRKERTALHGLSYDLGNILTDTPQGSISGFSIFLICITDLTYDLRFSLPDLAGSCQGLKKEADTTSVLAEAKLNDCEPRHTPFEIRKDSKKNNATFKLTNETEKISQQKATRCQLPLQHSTT